MPTDSGRRTRARNWTAAAGALALAAAAVFLASRNADPVAEIDLYFASYAHVPLWRALLGAAAVGAALAALACAWPIVRLKLGARRSRKRIAALEQEVHGLRTLPLGDETGAGPSAREG